MCKININNNNHLKNKHTTNSGGNQNTINKVPVKKLEADLGILAGDPLTQKCPIFLSNIPAIV